MGHDMTALVTRIFFTVDSESWISSNKLVQHTYTCTTPIPAMCYTSVQSWLTQVKELGAVVYDCKCLADDLGKIFEAYWFLGESKTIPAPWPSQYTTDFNKDTPMQLPVNGTDSRVYLSVRDL